MSFEIAYKTECSAFDFYYPTDENQGKPFYSELNEIAEEIKSLQQQILERKEKMVEIANKLVKQDKTETKQLTQFQVNGAVEVDDEEVTINDELWDSSDEASSPVEDEFEQIREKDWCIVVESSKSGRFCLKVAEGWDFDPEGLEWKDDCLQYEGERIDNDYEGTKWADQNGTLNLPLLKAVEDTGDLDL
jgi:hypothetical protein